jgi:hypothetical protein
VPRSGSVSGWTVDPSFPGAGKVALTATTLQEAESLIDGGAANFFTAQSTPKVFAWQSYVNASLAPAPDQGQVSLYILQMPSANQAKGLFESLLQNAEYGRRAGTPFDWQAPTTPAVGTYSRIQDTGTSWWINFYKDVFYVEVMLSPSYGPPPDFVVGDVETKTEALRFAQAVAGKI